MRSSRTYVAIALLGLSSLATASDIPLKNWLAPKTWTPAAAQASGGRSALATATYPPLPFIPLTPCRVVDTRVGMGFSGGYGPPALVALGTRNFTIGGQCGIPADAQAVSFEFTAVNITAAGNLRAYPDGVTPPMASVLNWPAAQGVIGNGIVVPLGAFTEVLDVYLNSASPVDLVLDVNGFYGPSPADQTPTFILYTSSPYPTMALTNNSTTCSGYCGLISDVQSGNAIVGDTFSGNAYDVGVLGAASAGIGLKGITGGFAGDATGVLGQDAIGAGSPTGYLSAGVRGEGHVGVFGVSNTSTSVGVYGAAISPAINGVYGVSNHSGGVGVAGAALAPATWGVYAFGDLGATGTKPFVEPHPTDASKEIRYVALEGPEAGTYFRGTSQTQNGMAVISVPETFRMVTDEAGLTVQVTATGRTRIWVESEDLNTIVVRSDQDVRFHYHVNGIRHAYKDWEVVSDSIDFRPSSPNQIIPSYLSEEAKNRLIANGTYNLDGTVNMNTAERMGWAQAWREQAAAIAAKLVKHP